ncbi:YopX family protein [Paenibacillus camelliae]|uniref:YopX family protein n=1 Tax=Paenibacillus camelliae TaxID=512410 RepID=UPI002040A310|nr:YopX family protein [Paenibacillus camelliae]MCM3632882.1 YopX family protein [Paenibacillus camelliae]
MRDYKFRGKRLDNVEWVISDSMLCNDDGEVYLGKRIKYDFGMHDTTWYLVDPATVGQYSTVNLKDGTKLFTGDIVQHITAKWIGVIVFDDGAFRVKSKHGTWVLDKLRAEGLVKLANQTDNPELLEG